MTEKFFTTLEVADFLKISDRTVRNLCANGDIKFNRIGNQIRISESQLQNYLVKTNSSTEKENEDE